MLCNDGKIYTISRCFMKGWESMVTMEEQKVQQLNISDRCDRCNAQAFVIAKGVNGELYFCGHHFTKHEEMLYNWAYEIVDERDYINQKSQSSA